MIAGNPVDLIVNGKSHQAESDSTLEALVREVSDRESGIAVARNGEVVPRSEWARTPLGEGDRVDVVTAVQGG
jgi:sulfur carrier protein